MTLPRHLSGASPVRTWFAAALLPVPVPVPAMLRCLWREVDMYSVLLRRFPYPWLAMPGPETCQHADRDGDGLLSLMHSSRETCR